MLQKTQDPKSATMIVAAELPDEEAPAYSDEFLSVMIDYAYETLRHYLECRKGIRQDAIRLLDDIVVLGCIRKTMASEKNINYMLNFSAAECVANISQSVIGAGGYFLGPSLAINDVRKIKR